jgi:hypothetical protein
MSLTLPSPRSLSHSLPQISGHIAGWLGRRPATSTEMVWEPVVCATPGCPRRDREAFETAAGCPGCGQVLTAAQTVVESPGWWR